MKKWLCGRFPLACFIPFVLVYFFALYTFTMLRSYATYEAYDGVREGILDLIFGLRLFDGIFIGGAGKASS